MWLLEANAWQAMQAAIKAGTMPTAEQQAQFEATHISALSEGGSRILAVAGSTAEILIKGVLTKSPSFLAMLFGGGNTTYGDIDSAINDVENNPDIIDVVFAFETPGGDVDGLFNTIELMRNMKKHTTARVVSMAASAGYAMAAQCNTIVASNNAVRVGSVGILAQFEVNENKISITSTNAPKKAPDVTTPEGVAIVREGLDAMHELFVEAIAVGRGETANTINNSFGQGATLLAGEALKRGMIDSIATPSFKVVNNHATPKTAAIGGDNSKVKSMDLATLKAEHPEAYAAAVKVGYSDGETAGVTQERDRMGAHLIMGESYGAMDTAIAACKDGTEMTETMRASYFAAGKNTADVSNRNEDDAEAGAAGDQANAEEETAQTDAEAVAAGLEAHFGTNTGAK